MSLEIVQCPECDRRTPVKRATCLYCGAVLPVTKIDVAPPQRIIDDTEPAFNTILEPPHGLIAQGTIEALASALMIEMEEAQGFLAYGIRLPVARSQTRQEADLITSLLRDCGLSATTVPDTDLRLRFSLLRARRIYVTDGGLGIFHFGGTMVLAPQYLKLIVIGLLRTKRVDYTEGITSSRKNPSKLLDSFQFSSEELLLDAYTSELERSFRVKADGFDFSGLVNPLSYRVDINFQALVAALIRIAPNVRVNRDFADVQGLLSRAWPERSRGESLGIRRGGLVTRTITKSTIQSDNKAQFDRHSRLMSLSLLRERQ